MQADSALNHDLLKEFFPFSDLKGRRTSWSFPTSAPLIRPISSWARSAGQRSSGPSSWECGVRFTSSRGGARCRMP